MGFPFIFILSMVRCFLFQFLDVRLKANRNTTKISTQTTIIESTQKRRQSKKKSKWKEVRLISIQQYTKILDPIPIAQLLLYIYIRLASSHLISVTIKYFPFGNIYKKNEFFSSRVCSLMFYVQYKHSRKFPPFLILFPILLSSNIFLFLRIAKQKRQNFLLIFHSIALLKARTYTRDQYDSSKFELELNSNFFFLLFVICLSSHIHRVSLFCVNIYNCILDDY